MKTIILLIFSLAPLVHSQTGDKKSELSKEETIKKFGQTPDQIKDYFIKLGNTKTEIVVGEQKLYSPLNLNAYLEEVKSYEKEIKAEGDSDGVKVKDRKGRSVSMIPAAAMFIPLKADVNFPEANAALAYILIDGNNYIAVVIIKSGDEYIALLKNKMTAKIEVRDGDVGFETLGKFIRIKSVEFDT